MNASRKPLLTLKAAAAILGCSEATVRNLITAGELPFVNIGVRKCLRIDPNDLDTFIQQRRSKFESPSPKQPRPRLKHIKL